MTKRKEVLRYIIILLVALIVSHIISRFIHPVIVNGDSMNPTLENGDIAISSSLFKISDLKKGDIVVFDAENIEMVKRIIAIPGDEIWIEDGLLYVNSEKSQFQYDAIHDPGILEEPIIVPDNEFFCVGDNCNNSYDCRVFGTINFSQIKYKVLKKLP